MWNDWLILTQNQSILAILVLLWNFFWVFLFTLAPNQSNIYKLLSHLFNYYKIYLYYRGWSAKGQPQLKMSPDLQLHRFYQLRWPLRELFLIGLILYFNFVWWITMTMTCIFLNVRLFLMPLNFWLIMHVFCREACSKCKVDEKWSNDGCRLSKVGEWYCEVSGK